MLRIKRYLTLILILLIKGGYPRAKFLKKIHHFKNQGDNCFFQPYNFGSEPNLISFGNNVHVATRVSFITHDVIALMFRNIDGVNYKIRYGEIKVGDNVFIGADSTILYDVEIGDNVIIGAGSLVNKDIPSGSIAAGVPCKIIGNFDDYKLKLKV